MQNNYIDRHKKIINIIAVGLFVMITLSFVRSISKMLQIEKQVEEKQQKLEGLRKTNEEIKNRLKNVESNIFLEKQLRDNLGLAKEGDVVIVLPNEDVLRSLSPKINEEEKIVLEPIWSKWLKLFL